MVRKEIQRERNRGWYRMSSLLMYQRGKKDRSRQKEQPGQRRQVLQGRVTAGEVQFSGVKSHTYLGSMAATRDTAIKSTERPAMKFDLGLGSVEN